jgi:hypothetical protein
MQTNDHLLDEITAAMADTWLAACERRVLSPGIQGNGQFFVWDQQVRKGLFGPASPDECRLFIHRAVALDVLRMLGTERVAGAAMVAGGNLPVALNG